MASPKTRISPSVRRSLRLPAKNIELVTTNPHSELNLKEALNAAKHHHDLIQEAARRTLEAFELGERHKEARLKRLQEEEVARLKETVLKEEEAAREEELRKIRAEQEVEKLRIATEKKKLEESTTLRNLKAESAIVEANKLQPAPLTTTPKPLPQIPSTTLEQTTKASTVQPPSASNPSLPSHVTAQLDVISKVHRNLKQLRKDVAQFIKAAKGASNNPSTRGIDDMGRDLCKWVGQLTPSTQSNKKQLNWILETLKEAQQLQCPSVDPNDYLFEQRQPTGAGPDVPRLSSAYIYLLNIFAKRVIKQFAQECGTNTKAADPIAVLVMQVFARPDFHWRGHSLIDILMTKLYISAPVVIGVRSNETTDDGRRAVGWFFEDGKFAPETGHVTRQTGIATGYAALTLRDFSRSTMSSPLPPWHYWRTFATIVNTPSDQICNTQLIVLKAMIDGHEQRFLTFYGSVAIAALKTALVDLPRRCPVKGAYSGALEVMGLLLAKNTGLLSAS